MVYDLTTLGQRFEVFDNVTFLSFKGHFGDQ